ncbi:lmo0937 family membrane protein [Methylomarinum sp. Ch1-1]|uniref:Lmo0937 family membrane protein n=1 Tax=Methylomarinum roseum TaxID=3067653 RepID=A0AAU7P0E0_9GAMM
MKCKCRQWTAPYGEAIMLETLAILLIILWLLGLVSSYTLGGFIHILLVIAVIVIVLRIIRGRRPM